MIEVSLDGYFLISSYLVLVFTSAALGLSVVCAQLFSARVDAAKIYAPMALRFFCNAFTVVSVLLVQPVIIESYPFYSRLFALAAEPFNLMLAPLFWIYVRGLTSRCDIAWLPGDYQHFIPGLIAVTIPCLVLILGDEKIIELFEGPRGHTRERQLALIWLVKIVQFASVVQVVFYVILIAYRLRSYRAALTELFASTDRLELYWVRGLMFFLITYIALTFLAEYVDSVFELEFWESILDFCVLWFIAAWGLRIG